MEDVIFWELGGYKKVLEDLRQGQRSCELFMKMVQERADIEERYARSLESWRERWIQSVTKGREVGRAVQAWCACLEEATEVSQVHRACMDRLTGSKGPIVNMMGWIDEHYKRSDNNGFHLVQRLEKEFETASEEFSDEYNRAARAKEAYHTLSKEAQKARRFAEVEEQESKVNDTTKTRLFSRADKLTIRENYVRRIYKRRIAGCQGEVKDRYKEQMEGVLGKCREVESARLQCLQNQILTFISLLDMTSSSESLLESCRNRYKKVAANDPSLDVQEWLFYFHLNKFIELPAFEEYYLDEEDYEPLGKREVSTDKTKRPSGSFFQLSLFASSSEDESSGTGKSSSSSTSSESASSSASSESESEMSAPTSVSSLPRSSLQHQYDTIPQAAMSSKEHQYQTIIPSTEDEQHEGMHTDATLPHSTLSTGFPINQESQASLAKHSKDNQIIFQVENAAPRIPSEGSSVLSQHHVYDVPDRQFHSTEDADKININFSSEGNKEDIVTTHNKELGLTQSRGLLASETNVQNVTEISTPGYDNNTIIESSEQSNTSFQIEKRSEARLDSQSDHTKLPGFHSPRRNQVFSNRDNDVSNSKDLTYNNEVQDGAIGLRSFVGPYFVSKNFRWASVSPPVAAKETSQHLSETYEVKVKNDKVFRCPESAESRIGTDSVESRKFFDRETHMRNSDSVGYPRLEEPNAGVCKEDSRSRYKSEMTYELPCNGTDPVGQRTPKYESKVDMANSSNEIYSKVEKTDEDVCKEDDCNHFQPQTNNECEMRHHHYQVTDRPIKECLARWFLGKYPEYAQHEENMWEHLRSANPCRYRAAMIDAKRLMFAVGARSMICSSSDKPRALHLCNSLHRCRQCVDENEPCQCHHEGLRPLFRQHTNGGISESKDLGSDLSHFEVNREKRHHQNLECDLVYQEATNRILHLHGKLSDHNDFRQSNCGNLYAHSKESDHVFTKMEGNSLNNRCVAGAGRDTCKSIGKSSTSKGKYFQFQVHNDGYSLEKGSSEINAKNEKTPASSFCENSTISQGKPCCYLCIIVLSGD
ncbi:Protein kinase C and casein kinase substrate in neurons protein 2 [Holothuria leucospilota]|uniref:Protein kinase C and casein kinase substrate in neurons protein 2 n=1 Tax=Holothuria leucospilota TaxID=206669 RepID=A0A9Q0YK08_HOLLE|nr:Protein kinase C and casein kinase substrate in neurons protein 2 [Holothuria leucospilota]